MPPEEIVKLAIYCSKFELKKYLNYKRDFDVIWWEQDENGNVVYIKNGQNNGDAEWE